MSLLHAKFYRNQEPWQKNNFLCAQSFGLYGSFGLQLERTREDVELQHLCSTLQRSSAKVVHVRYVNIAVLRLVFSFFGILFFCNQIIMRFCKFDCGVCGVFLVSPSEIIKTTPQCHTQQTRKLIRARRVYRTRPSLDLLFP